MVADGTRIALSVGEAFSESHLRAGIYVMNADGTAMRWVAPGHGPVWSPDSSKIAFRGDGNQTVHADGTHLAALPPVVGAGSAGRPTASELPSPEVPATCRTGMSSSLVRMERGAPASVTNTRPATSSRFGGTARRRPRPAERRRPAQRRPLHRAPTDVDSRHQHGASSTRQARSGRRSSDTPARSAQSGELLR